ncbi:MAG: class I SAM-dependent RNA methyltransferase [Candidatus Delongbacteria bacterium]|nr:class I SAM-dependent RNA methyltransferase [Candidatus Delongbacteria bacterium]
MKYNLIATCTFGLESVLKKELIGLGYNDLQVQDGRITFQAEELGIARANLFLRTADRIYLKLSEFKAEDFDELYEGVKNIDWQDMVPVDGVMHVNGRSKKSKLSSVPACQSITKKAIIDKMTKSYGVEKFTEDGKVFPVEIILENDIAIVTLDTSGTALYKRGYRLHTGEAPLKETLAAGLILLSNWRPNIPLIDPFCGSGTILVEAAMIGRNIAPGLNRHFLSMKWDFLNRSIWKKAVEEAFDKRNTNKLELFGSDIDPKVIKYAQLNSENADLNTMIEFKQQDITDFKFTNKKAYIITNLPYGERLRNKSSIDELYRSFKNSIKYNDQFGKHIFTSHEHFQEIFGRANKKRKLYNGNIKCHLYSYY